MMGKTKLSAIKAQLGISSVQSPGEASKLKPIVKPDEKALAETLQDKLAELERLVM